MNLSALVVLLAVILSILAVGRIHSDRFEAAVKREQEECTRELLIDKTVYPETVLIGEDTAIVLNITAEECIEMSKIPLDVMLVIDRSGSMVGKKLQDAKDAAKKFVEKMNAEKHRVGVVSFADTARLNQKLTASLESATEAIDDLSAVGWTNLGEGIRKSNEELIDRGRGKSVKAIIILTDGVVNRMYETHQSCFGGHLICPVEHTACTSYVLSEATDAKDNGFYIYTIGLGMHELCPDNQNPEQGREFIRGVLRNASTSDECYYEAPTSEDLEEIYDDIADRLTNIVATDVVVKDVIPVEFDYVSGSLSGDCEYDDSTKTIFCDLGIFSAGESQLIGFVTTPNQEGIFLSNVHPDSQVRYKDYWGLSRRKIFPEVFVTVRSAPVPPPPPPPDGYDEFDCNGTAEFVYDIDKGWNLISSPCVNVAIVEDGCGAKTAEFYHYDALTRRWVIDTIGLESLAPGVGYWFLSKKKCEVVITGTERALHDYIKIKSGWNTIGSPLGGLGIVDTIELQHRCQDCGVGGTEGSCSAFKLLLYDPIAKSYAEASSLEQGKGYMFNCIK